LFMVKKIHDQQKQMRRKPGMIPAPKPAICPGSKIMGETGNTKTLRGLTADIPLLRAKITIAADSCSLIFLNRLNILEAYAAMHEIVLTQAIYDEITLAPDNTNITDNRTLYKKLLDERVLSVSPVTPSPTNPHGTLSAADRSLIHAYETLTPDGILTDDKSVCRYCRKNAIPYINTPMALFVLLYNGTVSRDQYITKLHALYDMGRYGQFVCDFMQELYSKYCKYTNSGQ